MGTTAEKLKYLNETKAEIKNALETPYNVMRDYPELIKKYIDNQPTKVVTDGMCGNAVDVPVKAIEINGNIRQETTEGRQLFDNTLKGYGHYGAIAKTIPTGVRLSVNADTTASDYTFGLYATINLSNFVGKTVRMKAMFKSNSNLKGTYSIGLCSSNGISRVPKGSTGVSEKEISFVIPSLETGQEYLGVWFYTNSGGTGVAGDYVDYTNVIITIDNEDMTYEPYTGGIPSPNPDYTQKITSVGGYDNIFDKNNIISGSYVSDGNGSFISNSTSKRTDYIEIQANSYYYIYSDKTSGNWGAWYDKDKNFISGITLGGKKEGVVNSPANAKYMAFAISYQGNLTDYSNIKINETAIKIKQSGKNKLDFKKILKNANVTYTEQDGVFNLANNGNLYSVPYKLNLKPNTTYTIYQNFQEQNSTNVRLTIARGSNYEKVVESYSTSETESYRKKTFTTDESSDYYIRGDWSLLHFPLIYNEPILVEGTDDASYEPYHEPIITPINLQGNILSKAGDVKDILKVNRNGEVEIKKNIEKIVLTGSEKLVEKSSSTTRTYWGIDFSNYGIYQYNDPTKVCDVLTTKFKPRPQQGSFLPGQVALITGKKNVYFIFEPDTTEEQARAILTDMPVYFRLAEPQTIKLSSISPIELWQGTNIFKLITNLDTDFEVEYVVDKDSVTKEEE